MGVVECLNHRLVEPFNVLYEKDGECIIDVSVPVPCQLRSLAIVSCPDRRSSPRSDGLAREVEFLGFMGGATSTLIKYLKCEMLVYRGTCQATYSL